MEVVALVLIIGICMGGVASLIYLIIRYSRQRRGPQYDIPMQYTGAIKDGKETSMGTPIPVARLIVVDEASLDQIYDIYQRSATIGRGMNNDIVIKDPYVTNQHARLAVRNGMYLLVDLISTNGTYLNGQRIKNKEVLNHQDIIELGRTKIRFEQIHE